MISGPALDLLRLHAERPGPELTDDNRPLYRELASEGLVLPGSSFTRGHYFYVPTELGRKLIEVLRRARCDGCELSATPSHS